jgi:hypothetical protein
MALNLPLSTVTDTNTRKAFEQVQQEFNNNPLNLSQMRLFRVTETAAVTGKELHHGLGFIPTDIIITKDEGSTVVWDYDRFTKDKIYYTTSGAVDLRILLGRIT